MKKRSISVLAVVIGAFVLTGFSVDNQSPKKAPSTINVSNDYANFTQYMQ